MVAPGRVRAVSRSVRLPRDGARFSWMTYQRVLGGHGRRLSIREVAGTGQSGWWRGGVPWLPDGLMYCYGLRRRKWFGVKSPGLYRWQRAKRRTAGSGIADAGVASVV